jgi:hypothetical protein
MRLTALAKLAALGKGGIPRKEDASTIAAWWDLAARNRLMDAIFARRPDTTRVATVSLD